MNRNDYLEELFNDIFAELNPDEIIEDRIIASKIKLEVANIFSIDERIIFWKRVISKMEDEELDSWIVKEYVDKLTK